MYLMYRNATPVALDEPVKVQESNGHIVGAVKMGTIDPNHAGAGLGGVGKVWSFTIAVIWNKGYQWQKKVKKRK